MNLYGFDYMLGRSGEPVGLSSIFILTWLAACDGTIAEEENEALHALSKSLNQSKYYNDIVTLARDGRVEDLKAACEILRTLDSSQKSLFLEMSIGITLEDGYLVTPENHALRFLADLLEIGQEGLNQIFLKMTGHRFPMPSDPSSIEWWKTREQTSKARNSHAQGGSQDRYDSNDQPQNSTIGRLRDLAILGLDESATSEDIRMAFRRMAMMHHPDRFASLGADAVLAAEATFKRIRSSYERLANQ